jgi:hypothetical protein
MWANEREFVVFLTRLRWTDFLAVTNSLHHVLREIYFLYKRNSIITLPAYPTASYPMLKPYSERESNRAIGSINNVSETDFWHFVEFSRVNSDVLIILVT